MAKKSGLNKSKLIREYLSKHPNAGPNEVVTALKVDHNLDVKPQFVSTIKSNDKRNGGKPAGKRGRKPGSKNASSVAKAAVAGNSVGTFSYETLSAAKAFIQKIGGAKKAKAAIDLLADLS